MRAWDTNGQARNLTPLPVLMGQVTLVGVVIAQPGHPHRGSPTGDRLDAARGQPDIKRTGCAGIRSWIIQDHRVWTRPTITVISHHECQSGGRVGVGCCGGHGRRSRGRPLLTRLTLAALPRHQARRQYPLTAQRQVTARMAMRHRRLIAHQMLHTGPGVGDSHRPRTALRRNRGMPRLTPMSACHARALRVRGIQTTKGHTPRHCLDTCVLLNHRVALSPLPGRSDVGAPGARGGASRAHIPVWLSSGVRVCRASGEDGSLDARCMNAPWRIRSR